MAYTEKGDKLHINMTKRATEELEELTQRTGMSKTDLVCRSIGLYRFITSRQLDGADLLIRDKDGEVVQVHFQ